jgi:hypothetical protein
MRQTGHIIITHNRPVTVVAITTTATSIMYRRVTRIPARRPIARLQLPPRTRNLRDPTRQNRSSEDASLDLQKWEENSHPERCLSIRGFWLLFAHHDIFWLSITALDFHHSSGLLCGILSCKGTQHIIFLEQTEKKKAKGRS